MLNSELLTTNRYNSFASVKQNCTSKYYIDGKDYFADVYDLLMDAKK